MDHEDLYVRAVKNCRVCLHTVVEGSFKITQAPETGKQYERIATISFYHDECVPREHDPVSPECSHPNKFPGHDCPDCGQKAVAVIISNDPVSVARYMQKYGGHTEPRDQCEKCKEEK